MRLAAVVLINLLSIVLGEALHCYECDIDVCVPNRCAANERRCLTFHDVGGRPTGGCTTKKHCKFMEKMYKHQSSCCDTNYCNERL